MTIVQDQLLGTRANVTFENVNNTNPDRLLHNGSQVIKLDRENDLIRYFSVGGDQLASFSFEESEIVDFSYDKFNDEYYSLRLNTSFSPPALTIEKTDNEGQVDTLILEQFNVLSGTTLSSISGTDELSNGQVQMSVGSSQFAYVKVLEDVYRVSVSGTYTSGPKDETETGISVGTSVIEPSGTGSFSFNETSGGFLMYSLFDSNTDEVQVKTVTAAATPLASDRKLFLEIPDWEEHAAVSGSGEYKLFLHGSDHNTLFYFRKNGIAELNPLKISNTDAETVENGSLQITVLTSTGSDFNIADVKEGDLVSLGSSFYVVDQVNSAISLTLQGLVGNATGQSFEIFSNADLIQFNIDPTISAFSEVNVDDFSLRAGTTDATTVTVEVINAWGDPLSGKNVSFVVSTGAGAVSPTTDITDSNGEATTVYTAGVTPGAVNITTTISD